MVCRTARSCRVFGFSELPASDTSWVILSVTALSWSESGFSASSPIGFFPDNCWPCWFMLRSLSSGTGDDFSSSLSLVLSSLSFPEASESLIRSWKRLPETRRGFSIHCLPSFSLLLFTKSSLMGFFTMFALSLISLASCSAELSLELRSSLLSLAS